MSRKHKGLTPIAEILTAKLLKEIKGPSIIQQRLIDGAAFQHREPGRTAKPSISAHGFMSDLLAVPRPRRRSPDMGTA